MKNKRENIALLNKPTEFIQKLFIIFIATFLFLALVLCFVYYIYSISIQDVDFRAIYTGASMLLHGYSNRLYSLHDQYLFQKTFLPNLHSQKLLDPYLTPPIVAFFLSPLAFFPVTLAYLIWTSFNLFMLLVLCGFILFIFKTNKWQIRILICTMLLFNFSIWQGIIGGQIFMFLMASSFLGWYMLRKRDHISAGLILSIIAVKPYLIPVLGIGLLLKRPRAFAGFIIGITILFLLSLVLIGINGMQAYRHLLFSIPGWGNQYGMYPVGENTWGGLLLAYFHIKTFSFIWFIGVITVILILIISLKKNSTSLFDLQWALIIIIMIFVGPHVLPYDLSLLFVAGFTITKYALSLPNNCIERHILLTFLVIGYICITMDFMFNHLHLTVILMISAICYITFYIYKVNECEENRVGQCVIDI